MRRRTRQAALLLALALAPACAGRQAIPVVQTVMVPPRIDLKQHEMIGIVEFASTARGRLGALATRRFMESARRDQGLVRMVQIEPGTAAARSSATDRWDPETFKGLGRERGVKTFMTGRLTVSPVRPNIQVSALLRSGQASAQVNAVLEVQMIEAATGASIWSSSGSAVRTLGNLRVLGGKDVSFDADDPDRAYGDLVDALVEQVTRDFHVSWEER